MAKSSRQGALRVSGVLLVAAAAAWFVLGRDDPASERLAATPPAPSAVQVAVASVARFECNGKPLLRASGSEDGKLGIPTNLEGKKAKDATALIVLGKEAAAAGRPRDAELAFLTACQVGLQAEGDACQVGLQAEGDASPIAADAKYQLGRHYTLVAGDASRQPVPASELHRNARLLLADSLQLYRVKYGEQHEKTRFAAESLASLQQKASGAPRAVAAGSEPAQASTDKPAAAAAAPATPAATRKAEEQRVAAEKAAQAQKQAESQQAAAQAQQLAQAQRAAQERQAAEAQRVAQAQRAAQDQAAQAAAAQQAAESRRAAELASAAARAEQAALAQAQRAADAQRAAEARRAAELQQAAATAEAQRVAQAQQAVEAQRVAQAQQAAAAQRAAEAQRVAQAQRQADAQQAAQRASEAAERTARAAPSTTARARPSFDCAKARSTNEKLICGDEELASLDRELGRLHARAKEQAGDRRAFQRESDRQWQQRESNCKDSDCLRRWYAQRRAQLEQQAAAAPARAPVAAAARTPRPRPDVREAPPSEPMAAADSTTMQETPRASRETRGGDPAPRVIMRPADQTADDAPARQPRVIVLEPSSELAPSGAGASQ